MDEKKRWRKKQLYQDIIKQVEFYLSSANLSKDRFMFQALAENENGLELTLLLRCNKLRSFTTDINILKKALRLSENLELTDNELRVKSKIPFTPKENVDECTIYVERLPLDANIDFLKQIFTQFGSVDYVSLPKFQNGKIKGFAFIEFSEPSSALKTIEEFRKTGSYLPIDMDPFNLRSVCTIDKKTKEKLLKGKSKNDYDECSYSRDEEDMAVVTEEIENVEIEISKPIDDSNVDSDDCEKKRKHKSSPSTLERKKKKVKSDKKEECDSSILPDTSSNDDSFKLSDNCTKGDDLRLHDVSTNDKPSENISNKSVDVSCEEPDEHDHDEDKDNDMVSDNAEEPSDNTDLQAKKRRRQKKKPKRPTVHSGLMILSKADWKKLRNMYLNSQRAKMRLLKKHLYRCKQHAGSFDDGQFTEGLHDTFASSNNGIYHMDIIEVPKSVVKILLDEPVIDVKGFKKDVKTKSDDIMNVDVKEGSSEVHIRLSSAEATGQFISNNQNWNCSIIKGQEELNYWKKIRQNRENKKEKQSKKIGKMEDVIEQDNNEPSITKSISKGLIEKPTLTVLPGTIVKVETSESIIDIKHFKNVVKKSCADVAYVDVVEGTCEAFIRLNTTESAQVFATSGLFGQSKLLSGDEEQCYWNKINEDRTNKFNKTVRINKRGKQKIIKKAEKVMGKHIILEDPEDIDSTVANCEFVEMV